MWLFVAFLAVPLIEITLFVQIGGAIGLGWTLATVIVTALLGTFLVRNQGVLAINSLRSSLSELRDPTEPLFHGAMILFSGALLLTPGFFTDAVGFLLLVPSLRAAAYRAVRARINVAQFEAQRERRGPARPRPGARDDVIDADYADVTDESDETPKAATEKSGRRTSSGWTKH